MYYERPATLASQGIFKRTMGGIPKSAHCFPRVSSQRVAELRKACLAHGINSPLAKVPQNVSRASTWIHFPIRTSASFTGVHSFVCYVAFVAAPSGAEKVALMPQRTLLQEDTPSSSKLRVTSALWPGSTTAELSTGCHSRGEGRGQAQGER